MTDHVRTAHPSALARLRRRALGFARRLGGEGSGISPRAYAESARSERYFHRTLRPGAVHRAPLPGNMARRGDLRRDRHPWGFSFHDVPERRIDPRCVACLPECRIVPGRNRWGSEFHAIVARDGREVRLRGTGFPPDEELEPLGAAPPVDLGEAAWIVGRWHRNYYHWLVYHLPQVMAFQELGVVDRILIPRAGRLAPVIEDSLQALGLAASGLRSLPPGPARADPLWVVESDRFDPELLRELRRRIAGSGRPPSRRVYLSRDRARKRRLAGAAQTLGSLESAGFELVEAEDLEFQEQVALASETAILAGVHGAGLANMIFMPEGAHVVELANPRYPSPAFYALASALGLRYWLLWGTPSDERGRAALDVEVDPRAIERVIADIEAGG